MTVHLDEVDPVETDPAPSVAAGPVPLSLDQTDLVYALVLLRNKLSEVVVRATTQGPRNCPWADLAAVLDSAAALCRHEAILEPQPTVEEEQEAERECRGIEPAAPSQGLPRVPRMQYANDYGP